MMNKFAMGMTALIFVATALFSGLALSAVFAQESGAPVADTAGDPVASLTGLIVSVSALVGGIATIISVVGSKALAKGLVKEADKALVEKIVHGADYLKGSDESIAEAADDIYIVADALASISPEFRSELEKRKVSIDAIKDRADALHADVERIHGVVVRRTG